MSEIFQIIKITFYYRSCFSMFWFWKKCIYEINSSDNVFAGIFSQDREDGLLHLVVFVSCKHPTQEVNYGIYDKKLLAIIKFFEKWRPMLEGTRLPI